MSHAPEENRPYRLHWHPLEGTGSVVSQDLLVELAGRLAGLLNQHEAAGAVTEEVPESGNKTFIVVGKGASDSGTYRLVPVDGNG